MANTTTNSNQSRNVRSLRAEVLLAVFLVLAIAISRWTIDLPNFKPVMAIAMFAGFLFHRPALAFATIFAGLLVSDALIGFYDIRVSMVVYLALLCPVVAGFFVNRWKHNSSKASLGVLGFAGLAAVNFYVLTTLAVWICFDWYPSSFAGLATAFAMGLPFFKWTLMSNIVFCTLLFGSVALVNRAYEPFRARPIRAYSSVRIR